MVMAFAVISCEPATGSTSSSKTKETEEIKDEPAQDPEEQITDDPLTLEFIDDGEITITNPWSTLKYSKNGGELNAVDASDESLTATITVAENDKICFFAEGSENPSSGRIQDNMIINCSSDCYIYGNIMSLVTLDAATGRWNPSATELKQDKCFTSLFYQNEHIKNHDSIPLILPATTLTDSCYQRMFSDCTSLTSAPALPAITLKSFCYSTMFFGCSSLTEVPELPAMTLTNGCYDAMFRLCISLRNAPKLPATTLADYCYENMFSNCSSLENAPELPATTLARNCYYRMFQGCSNLKSIKCLATDISATNCTYFWVDGVAASGTFEKAGNANTWLVGACGIPDGWTDDSFTEALTIEFIKDGYITISAPWSSLSYSINNSNKKRVETNNNNSMRISGITGDKVRFYAQEPSYIYKYMHISCYTDCYLYGNLMSLISYNSTQKSWNPNAKEITVENCFLALFDYNPDIKNHPSKSIVLPATKLSKSCYSHMFHNCTSLTSAPALPSTTLAYACYSNMFNGCSSLTSAPELPASTLEDYCYWAMFANCSNLSSIKCLATDISAECCTVGWLDKVAASGTFIKPAGTDWSIKTGYNGKPDGIPSGWTVEEAQ